ncbi:hypothetical protein ACSBR1_020200 [Camellia fascicularis]
MVDSYTNYISLKDLLPEVVAGPDYRRKDSWREIQIKDPLLQKAAWHYLRPRLSEPEDRRSCAAKFKDMCCVVIGCFGGVFDDEEDVFQQ